MEWERVAAQAAVSIASDGVTECAAWARSKAMGGLVVEGRVAAVLWVISVRANGDVRAPRLLDRCGRERADVERRVPRPRQARAHSIQYGVSDEHAGVQAALPFYSLHQRREAHNLRYALAAALQPVVPAMATWLDEALVQTLGDYLLPGAEARCRLRTANALARDHEEVCRRTRVVRIVPIDASFLRRTSAPVAGHNETRAKRHCFAPSSSTVNVRNGTRRRVTAASRHRSTHFRALGPPRSTRRPMSGT